MRPYFKIYHHQKSHAAVALLLVKLGMFEMDAEERQATKLYLTIISSGYLQSVIT